VLCPDALRGRLRPGLGDQSEPGHRRQVIRRPTTWEYCWPPGADQTPLSGDEARPRP
jgi:hypothetical protein